MFAYISTCLPGSNSLFIWSFHSGPKSTWFAFGCRSEYFLVSGSVSFGFCMFGLGWAFKGCIDFYTHGMNWTAACAPFVTPIFFFNIRLYLITAREGHRNYSNISRGCCGRLHDSCSDKNNVLAWTFFFLSIKWSCFLQNSIWIQHSSVLNSKKSLHFVGVSIAAYLLSIKRLVLFLVITRFDVEEFKSLF